MCMHVCARVTCKPIVFFRICLITCCSKTRRFLLMLTQPVSECSFRREPFFMLPPCTSCQGSLPARAARSVLWVMDHRVSKGMVSCPDASYSCLLLAFSSRCFYLTATITNTASFLFSFFFFFLLQNKRFCA